MAPPLSPDENQDAVIDHWKHPRHTDIFDGPGVRRAHRANPLCGDAVTVSVEIRKDGSIHLAARAEGCSICRATASMMACALQGKPVAEATRLAGSFASYLEGSTTQESLGDGEARALAALKPVIRAPIRRKCALLPFQALRQAME